MYMARIALFMCLMLSLGGAVAGDDKFPPAEEKIRNSVDHWGLPFSDQYRLYLRNFDKYSRAVGLVKPEFALGHETSLRKTFANKYWFKGQWNNSVQLSAGRNESEAFQLAILPAIGTDVHGVEIKSSPLKQVDGKGIIPESAVNMWRIGFVRTVCPQYPVKNIGDWPDPLLKLNTPFSLSGLEAGLIWWEVKVPKETPPGDYSGTITVSCDKGQPQKFTVRLHVWPFTLPDRIPRPTAVWIKGTHGTADYRKICDMFLEHHFDPISVGATTDLKLLDSELEYCFKKGLMYFQTPSYDPRNPEKFKKYYEHIKQKGWLDRALIYSVQDEPTESQFREKVIPRTLLVRKEFPGLKTFLASEFHPDMNAGTDIWMTDLSTNFHSWLMAGRPGGQRLWFYFCHLPIRVNLERPLTNAPNMLIDNDAIEHRVLNWMTQHYDAKGVFIWAGNMDWLGKNKDSSQFSELIRNKPTNYPYGGIHNGNGFLIYPGPLPSVRLKVMRDGIEDYWYLTELSKLADDGDKQAKELLNGIVPEIFVDTHYFNHDPQKLLEYRIKIGQYLAKVKQ